MKTAVLQIRLDAGLKKQAEDVLEEIGLSTTNAVRLILKQIVNRRGIPFELNGKLEEEDSSDPFYSESNQKWLMKAIADFEAGKYEKHELIEVED